MASRRDEDQFQLALALSMSTNSTPVLHPPGLTGTFWLLKLQSLLFFHILAALQSCKSSSPLILLYVFSSHLSPSSG